MIRTRTVFPLAAMAAALFLGACAGSTTRVDGANVETKHQTRIEKPGVTRTRTIEIEIGNPAPAQPAPPATTGEAIPAGGESLAAFHSVAFVQPVSWPADQKGGTEAEIARAIRDAAQAGHAVRFKIDESETIAQAADESAASMSDAGASLRTASDQAAVGFRSNTSGGRLPGGIRVGSGSTGMTADLSSAAGSPLLILGGIVMATAIIPLLRIPRRWGSAAIIAGVGLLIVGAGVVAASAPWVFIVALVALVALLGWLAWESWRSGRRGEALRTIAAGVGHASAELNASIRDEIKAAANPKTYEAVKAEVSAAKRAVGVK